MLGRITCICFILFFVTTVVSAQTVTIYRGGVALAPTYSTVKNAVANAVSNDSLVLSADTFREQNIVINKSLSISGTLSGSSASLIDATLLGDSSVIFFNNPSWSSTTYHLTIRDVDITNGFANNGFDAGGGAIFASKGTVLTIDGFSHLFNNQAPDSSMGFSGSKNGGAIYSEGDVFLKGKTKIYSNSAVNGGGVFSTKRVFVIENATIQNNTASQDGGGLYIFGEAQVLDSSIIQSNTADNGGACYVNNGLVYLKNTAKVNANAAQQKGGAFFFKNGYFRMADSAIISDNTTNLNYSSAIYSNGNNDITISGGQIVGNHSTDTNANGLGMALYSDSLTGTSSVIKINNARIFNPRHGNARQNEFYNLQSISAFLSDSTWWGESDTVGLIYNILGASVALRSWITCEWMLNAGIPIGMTSSFPLEAYFTLYTGAPIPPSMFWMLKGHFSSDFGTFTPPVAGMAATNIVSSVYTVPLSTSGVYLLATIDADTFRKSVYVHGTGIGKQYSEQQKAIHIYPNPATNNLNIVCKDDHTKYGKAIFKDVLGRVVLEEKFSLENKQSQLTFNLLAGVYIVELVLEGNVKQAERLVVL
jgi:hypothetical protein